MGAGAREGARLLSDRQGRNRLDRDAVLCSSAPFSANVAGLSHRLESRTREQQTHARDFLFSNIAPLTWDRHPSGGRLRLAPDVPRAPRARQTHPLGSAEGLFSRRVTADSSVKR